LYLIPDGSQIGQGGLLASSEVVLIALTIVSFFHIWLCLRNPPAGTNWFLSLRIVLLTKLDL
jgi:hypothetical protein